MGNMLLWKLSVTVTVVLVVHVACVSLWSVQGFLVTAPPLRSSNVCSFFPVFSPSETCYYRTPMTVREKQDATQDAQGDSKGFRPGQFFSKLFQGDKKKQDKRKEKDKKGDGMGDRFFKRFKRKEESKLDAKDEGGIRDMPQLTEAWENLGDKVKGLQKMVNNIRTEEDVSVDAEQRRLEELRKVMAERKKQQKLREERRKQEEKAKAQAKREAEKVAAARAKRIAKELKESVKKQKEKQERLRRIEAAAAAAKARSEENEARKKEEEEKKKGGTRKAAKKLMKGVKESLDRREEWIVVAPKTMMAPGAYEPVTAGGLDLLIVASQDGRRLYCVANSCPHLGTPLETGQLQQRPIEQKGKPISGTSPKTDGRCEDCIVCPLHRTAFALESGEVRGPWCPYPPVIGPMTGAVKPETPLAVFDIRTKGKNIEVRINSSLDEKGNKAMKSKR